LLDRGTAAAAGSRIDVKRLIVFRPIKNQRCVWMTTKSTFSALGANVTGLGAREPRVEGLALPKSVECGNLSFSRTGIRWMSDKARLAFAEGLVPKQDAS
jgi:hypothetical protein